MSLGKRLTILALVLIVPLVLGMLVTFEVINLEWISTMEISKAYEPMEKPLSVPVRSIPIDGPAYVEGAGAPENPVPADEVSLARGKQLYEINCLMCHGADGKGTGTIAAFLQNKPADLTAESVAGKSDGSLFIVISAGVEGKMPALNANLTIRDRWDVVNYIRSLQQTAQP